LLAFWRRSSHLTCVALIWSRRGAALWGPVLLGSRRRRLDGPFRRSAAPTRNRRQSASPAWRRVVVVRAYPAVRSPDIQPTHNDTWFGPRHPIGGGSVEATREQLTPCHCLARSSPPNSPTAVTACSQRSGCAAGVRSTRKNSAARSSAPSSAYRRWSPPEHTGRSARWS